jgi:hypothetical protein
VSDGLFIDFWHPDINQNILHNPTKQKKVLFQPTNPSPTLSKKSVGEFCKLVGHPDWILLNKKK